MKKVYLWILALVLVSFLAVGVFFALAPERIPVHYNARGEIDRWGSKYEYLVMPAMTALFAGIMVWVGRYESKRGRESNERVVAWMTVLVLVGFNAMWIFFMSKAAEISGSGGQAPELSVRGILILLMAILLLLGNRMPKLERNSMMGLRTKWSMADEVCWQKSQRLGGMILMAAGAIGVAVLAVLPDEWLSLATAVLLLGSAAAASAGSYQIWKRQQTK